MPASFEGLDDRELVEWVGRGCEEALEMLYSRYGSGCYGMARRVLGDEGLAQDTVQEVFLALWRSPERYDPSRGGFGSWVLSMTHHKAVDAVRREDRHRRRRASAEVLEHHLSDAPDLADETWSGMRAERVRAALKELPAPQREALALAYFGGHTQSEIAGLTDTPLGTVKTRMLSGMRKLALTLGEEVE